jgi:hypothetical protein
MSFSLSRAVVENGPDKLKLIPQGIQQLPETRPDSDSCFSQAAVLR